MNILRKYTINLLVRILKNTSYGKIREKEREGKVKALWLLMKIIKLCFCIRKSVCRDLLCSSLSLVPSNTSLGPGWYYLFCAPGVNTWSTIIYRVCQWYVRPEPAWNFANVCGWFSTDALCWTKKLPSSTSNDIVSVLSIEKLFLAFLDYTAIFQLQLHNVANDKDCQKVQWKFWSTMLIQHAKKRG